MKITALTLSLILLSSFCFSQNKTGKKNTIGVSIPLIFNYSNGIRYSLGNRKEPAGNAISYGININYSKEVCKDWFATVGLGYFNQSFNIIRPFSFDRSLTALLYYTKQYNYHSYTLNAGLGYNYALKNKIKLNGLASFVLLNSFKQSYDPNGLGPLFPEPNQINQKSLQIGYMVNISPGLEYLLSRKISIGADVVFPIITNWKKDEIFIKSDFGEDSQKIAENRFSIGTMLSCKYHF